MIKARMVKYFKGVRFVFIKTIIAILALFIMAILVFNLFSSRQLVGVSKNQDLALINSFKALYSVKHDFFDGIVTDYACYDWMIDFIKNPSQFDPKNNITSTNDLHLSVFQVFDLNKNTIYCKNTGLPDGDTLIFNDSFFNKLKTKREIVFFYKLDNLLIEIHASTVQKSNDLKKEGKPQGYLIIGKLWNKAYVDEISTITNSKLYLVLLKKKQKTLNKDKRIILLKDYNGNTIATVFYKPTMFFNNEVVLPKYTFNTYFIGLCIIVLVLLFVFFNFYILKPLELLDNSLKNEDINELSNLIKKENEFSGIAELVQEYFSQVEWAHDEIYEMQRTKDRLKQTYDELLIQKEKVEEQNNELEIQSEKLASAHQEIIFKNNQLEYQNSQITDSIKYASMIQRAVLLPQFNLVKTFTDTFIFFKPKEILSGDFYWFKEFYGKYYFACADCTGHGFSGAMMSMLGISFLNELTHHHNDRNITPSIILDKLRLKIVETLHQTGEIGQIRDGMDIVLCMYDPDFKTLDFAGAYNVLYQIITKDDNTLEIVEHKGDRMPVGIYDEPVPFTNYKINASIGDTFYMLTDGYIDQFGGPNRKKINKQNVKNLLLSVQHLNLSEQKLYIKEFLKSWIGNLEQVDDITVVGIKI